MQRTEVMHDQEKAKKELHVILGISGNSGVYIAEELIKLGYKVRGISRSGNGPTNIENIKADALNPGELTEAVKGASVIYHCLGLPYSQWFSKHIIIMKNLIQAAAANGPRTKIIFADNLYAIGKKGAKLGPMNEKTPELATERKGVLRKELVQMLLEAQKQGLIRVSIGKASDFFGPNASNSLFDHFVKPNIVKNKPSKFFADITTKHSWIYLPDFAKSLVVLGTEEKADGKVWILPHYEATSIKEFIEQFYVSVGVDIPVKVDKSPMILLTIVSIFNKDIREYAKMNYQRQADWIVDDSLFRSTFTNWKSTNLNNAFNETYDSYKKSLSE